MNIIDRLTKAQQVLEEHTQYDDQEGSGEDLARLTCIDAKLTIVELLDALKALVRSASRDRRGYDDTADWEDAIDAIQEAEAAITEVSQP